jgi:hypothetical protein
MLSVMQANAYNLITELNGKGECNMIGSDKEKLNKCLEILRRTELDEPLSWLWTWNTIEIILQNLTYNATVTLDDMWTNLCDAISQGEEFSLEFGAEAHHEDVMAWMYKNDWITDLPDDESID